jgi:hypothetical protein
MVFVSARRIASHDGPRLLREFAQREERWKSGDLADSLSVIKQRADARVTGNYSVTSGGETLFALVRVPSGRPDSASIAVYARRNERYVTFFALALFGGIPAALVVLTILWRLARG